MAALEPPSTRPCAVCEHAFTSEGFAKSQWKKGATAKCLACAKACSEADNAGTATRPEPKAALPEPKAASPGPVRGGLLGEVQALVPAMFLRSPPPGGKRTSLEKHHSTFMGHGEAWIIMLETYAQAAIGNKKAFVALEKMATSTSKGPGGRGEACFTKYLCGLVFLCPDATGSLRLRVDKEKAARYWIAAAKTGLAYAVCGLGNMARDGKLPGQAGADFALAQGLWARAWAECDLPEAAYNLGVCAGKGYGGPQDCSLALQWYTACRDSDLDGRGRAGDAPVGGRHGSLEELVEVGPSDAQTTFAAPAARNLVAVGKMLAMQGECEVGMEMLRNLAIMKARDGL